MGYDVLAVHFIQQLNRCIRCVTSSNPSSNNVKPQFITIIHLPDNWCKKCIEDVSLLLSNNSLYDTFFVFKKSRNRSCIMAPQKVTRWLGNDFSCIICRFSVAQCRKLCLLTKHSYKNALRHS